jgi:Polymerase beta, Nucleotidyltransferase
LNSKQRIALDLIAHWASRFDCIKAAVIYGSVARGDENQNSDLDVDLTYSDLSAPGMTDSYTCAHQSFDKLREDILCATGHPLRLSNYANHKYDHVPRDEIAHGTEIGVCGKARIVVTSPKLGKG